MGIVIGLLMTKLLASPRASGEKEKERERVSAFPFAASHLIRCQYFAQYLGECTG